MGGYRLTLVEAEARDNDRPCSRSVLDDRWLEAKRTHLAAVWGVMHTRSAFGSCITVSCSTRGFDQCSTPEELSPS